MIKFLSLVGMSLLFASCSINQIQPPGASITVSIASSVPANITSNNPSPTIFVTGNNLAAFQYGITNDPSNCSNSETYTSGYVQLNTNIVLSLASVPYGPVVICAVGTDQNGNQQSTSSASTYAWTYAPNPSISFLSAVPNTVDGVETVLINFTLPYPSYEDASFSFQEIDNSVVVASCPVAGNPTPCFSAQAGQDFEASAGQVTVQAGQTTAQIQIVIPPTSNVGSVFGINIFQGATDSGINVENQLFPITVP